jgi:hypothetical protein
VGILDKYEDNNNNNNNNNICSDAFWAKLSAFAFIGKSTHNCRFISSPGSIEVPFGVRLPPFAFLSFRRPWRREI